MGRKPTGRRRRVIHLASTLTNEEIVRIIDGKEHENSGALLSENRYAPQKDVSGKELELARGRIDELEKRLADMAFGEEYSPVEVALRDAVVKSYRKAGNKDAFTTRLSGYLK